MRAARLGAGVLALVLGVAACGGDGPAEQTTELEGTTAPPTAEPTTELEGTTAPPTAEPTTEHEGATAPPTAEAAPTAGTAGTSGQAGQQRPSFADRLALLPAVDADFAEVRLVDLDRAAALAGVTWPPADVPATIEALNELAGITPDATTFAPTPSVVERLAYLDEIVAATGWSPGQLDWYAEVDSPSLRALVGSGRIDTAEIAAAQGGGAEGPWRIGEGEDLEGDLSGDRTLDEFARPVTTAVADGVLGVALTAAALEPLLDGGGPTLADDGQVAQAAAVADAEGCYAAILLRGPELVHLSCQLPDTDGGPAVLLAAVGVDDPAAEADRVRDVLAEPTAPLADRLGEVAVEVVDDVVQLRARVIDGNPQLLLRALLQRDPAVPGAAG